MRPLLTLLLASVSWAPPVPAEVSRGFSFAASDPFRAGRHRGVDLAAAPGARARASCSGRVVTARPGLVTLRCGEWRVTHLPLASVSVRAGAHVVAGAPIGSVGASPDHAGLHVGVRRAGDRFGYVDPLPFLRGADPPPPPVAPAPPVGRRGPRPPAPRGAPAPLPDPLPAPQQRVRVRAPAGVAPWPAWLGVALLALGAVGGVRIRVRRRRRGLTVPVPSTR